MSKAHRVPRPLRDPIAWSTIRPFQIELSRAFKRFDGTAFDPGAKPGPMIDVAAEQPGARAKDSNVTLRLEKRKTDLHTQRSFGRFRRHVPLCFAPKDGKVGTTVEMNVLNLRIAKPANDAPRTRRFDVSGP